MTKTLDMQGAFAKFRPDSEAFIICGPTTDGATEVDYRGDLRQLKTMFRLIRDTLREKEKIGNHPNRPR